MRAFGQSPTNYAIERTIEEVARLACALHWFNPLVWVAALSLGAIWAVASFLFLRASFGARIGPRKPRS